MLPILMCLLVLGVAGAVVLREGLRDGPEQRATAPVVTKRAPTAGPSPARAAAALAGTVAGIGVVAGLALGLSLAVIAVVLRSAVGTG